MRNSGFRRGKDRAASEVVELVSGGGMGCSRKLHLSFGDHVHQFDASRKDPGAAKSLERSLGLVSRFT